MAAFAQADKLHAPLPGGVLFVGSSSIRLWRKLPQDFSQVPVLINRGFGGSTMADCHKLVRDLVIRYKPSQVLVYAGENDLAEGRKPADVLDSFRGFVGAVRTELPEVSIAYISIKPSPANVALLPQVQETNRLLADYVAALPRASYIDIHTAMLDVNGAPRPDLFGADRLHMNDAGYAIWRSAITRYVRVPQAGQVPATASLGPGAR